MRHEDRIRDLDDGCYRRLVGQLFAFCGMSVSPKRP